ncbi:hypothetical protein C2E23DRAFT_882253 [Lenzites betulinus]|nr:hypothetical protein C2E23DRAFT_882253 [Lenzites betulinus]
MTSAKESPNASRNAGDEGAPKTAPYGPDPWTQQAAHGARTNETFPSDDEEWNRVLEEAMNLKEQYNAVVGMDGEDRHRERTNNETPRSGEMLQTNTGTWMQNPGNATEGYTAEWDPTPEALAPGRHGRNGTPPSAKTEGSGDATLNPKLAMLLQIVSIGLATLATHGIFVQPPQQTMSQRADSRPAEGAVQEANERNYNSNETAMDTLNQHTEVDAQHHPRQPRWNVTDDQSVTEVDMRDQQASGAGYATHACQGQWYENAHDAMGWRAAGTAYASTAGRGVENPTGGSAAAAWGHTTGNTNPRGNALTATPMDLQQEAPEMKTRDPGKVQASQSRAHYLTTSGLLNITLTPTGGFPDVHANGPEDNLRYISDERLAAYDALPPGSACLIDLFGQGSLSEKRLKSIQPRIRNALILITGDENVRVEHPEPCPIGDSWDAPSIWIVWNLSPAAAAILIQQLVWDTALASFRIVPRTPLPPRYLFAVLNLKSDSKQPEAIRASFLTVMLFGEAYEITKNAIAKDRTSRFQSPEVGAVVIANSLSVDTVNMGGDLYTCVTGHVARIYCDPPTFDSELWTEWRDELRTIVFPFAEGPTRTGHRCKKCHGVDHTTHLCKFDKRLIPGWYGKIIPEVEKRRKGKQATQ